MDEESGKALLKASARRATVDETFQIRDEPNPLLRWLTGEAGHHDLGGKKESNRLRGEGEAEIITSYAKAIEQAGEF
jgi:hypothetical protein